MRLKSVSGRESVAAAACTPGSALNRSTICSMKLTFWGEDFSPVRVTWNVNTPSVRKPGSTSFSREKLLINNPAPMSSTSDSATSRSEEHTSELQSHVNLVCRLLLEKKKK